MEAQASDTGAAKTLLKRVADKRALLQTIPSTTKTKPKQQQPNQAQQQEARAAVTATPPAYAISTTTCAPEVACMEMVATSSPWMSACTLWVKQCTDAISPNSSLLRQRTHANVRTLHLSRTHA